MDVHRQESSTRRMMIMMRESNSNNKNLDDVVQDDQALAHHHYPDDEEEKKQRRLNNSTTGRRTAAAAGGGSGVVSCQAEKCTADLTESKRYHRRHKVCEVHAKAPSVLVSGLRQRFCQQCSRFHELSEFDDTKRSCRRRLAGHNERRRKSSSESQGEGGGSSSQTRSRPGDQEMPSSNSFSSRNGTSASAYKHFQLTSS